MTNLAPNLQPFATDARPPLAESSRRLLPWLIAVAFFMESLDTTILSTGVPAIAAALHVGPLSMKSVLASYTLSLAVFIPWALFSAASPTTSICWSHAASSKAAAER